MSNINATRDGFSVVVGLGPGLVKLPAGTEFASDALLDNRGNADAYIKFGQADVTVNQATGVRVPAGAIVPITKGAATHMAHVGDGATTLMLHFGSGD